MSPLYPAVAWLDSLDSDVQSPLSHPLTHSGFCRYEGTAIKSIPKAYASDPQDKFLKNKKCLLLPRSAALLVLQPGALG